MNNRQNIPTESTDTNGSRFLRLEPSRQKDIAGVYPQCHYTPGVTEQVKSRMYSFRSSLSKRELKDTTKPLTGLRLAGWARRTDCLSVAYLSFPIINRKALDTFLRFNLGHHQIIEVKVEKRGKVFDYYLINVMNNIEDYIDFPASHFEKVARDGASTAVSVKDLQEFIVQHILIYVKENETLLRPVELVMSKDFPAGIDLFTSRDVPSYGIYVSERLYEALEAIRITGLETLLLADCPPRSRPTLISRGTVIKYPHTKNQ